MLIQKKIKIRWGAALAFLAISTGVYAQSEAGVSDITIEPETLATQSTEIQKSDKKSAMRIDHSHMPIEIPAGIAAPALSLTIHKDTVSGLNLKLLVERYELIPPPPTAISMAELMAPVVNAENGFVEGHAHLYVNGEKIQRIYGRDVHLPASLFKPGINQLTVSINNHGHMYWTSEKRQILATLFIDFNADDLIKYRFESFPASQ